MNAWQDIFNFMRARNSGIKFGYLDRDVSNRRTQSTEIITVDLGAPSNKYGQCPLERCDPYSIPQDVQALVAREVYRSKQSDDR